MVTPHHFLMFATGAAQVPVTGFDPIPSINFVHDEYKSVPSASACSNTLYLYVNETTIHNPIHRYLVTALMNGGIVSKIWMSLPSKCMKYATSRYEGVFGKSKECFTFFKKLSQVEKTLFVLFMFPRQHAKQWFCGSYFVFPKIFIPLPQKAVWFKPPTTPLSKFQLGFPLFFKYFESTTLSEFKITFHLEGGNIFWHHSVQ